MKNYFKKFSILFVMLLSVISVGVITNGSVANAATTTNYQRGVQYLTPLDGYTRYDDSDKNITYSDNFKNASKLGEYCNALYKKDRKNLGYGVGEGKIKFSFYGTNIVLLDLIARNRTQNCTISFDGGETNEIFSSYSTDTDQYISDKQYQIAFFIKEGLDKRRHDVVINIPASSNSAFCLDAIDTDGYLLPYDESIALDKSTMNLTEANSGQLTATTTPSSVGVTWKLSDPSIATIEVDPTNGKITKVNALKEGTCTITATMADGSNLSASCTLNVTKKDVPKPDNPTTDTKTGAILIINLTDGETKVFDVSSSEVDKFKSWYNTKTEYENKLTYEFDKTINSNISVEEDVVHEKITSYEIRKY